MAITEVHKYGTWRWLHVDSAADKTAVRAVPGGWASNSTHDATAPWWAVDGLTGGGGAKVAPYIDPDSGPVGAPTPVRVWGTPEWWTWQEATGTWADRCRYIVAAPVGFADDLWTAPVQVRVYTDPHQEWDDPTPIPPANIWVDLEFPAGQPLGLSGTLDVYANLRHVDLYAEDWQKLTNTWFYV